MKMQRMQLLACWKNPRLEVEVVVVPLISALAYAALCAAALGELAATFSHRLPL